MTNLDRQLSEYVDAIADPVTLDEIVTAPARMPLWRSRPLFAMAAGAAVVLVPVIVIVATLRPTGSDTTVPPATTATTPVPETTAPPTTVPSTTLAPPRPVDPQGFTIPVAGIDGTFVVSTANGLVARDANGRPLSVLAYGDQAQRGHRPVASDRDGGLYVADNGVILHFAAGAPNQSGVPCSDCPSTSRRLAWVTVGDDEVLLHFGDTEDDFYGYIPATGEPWREGISSMILEGTVRFAGGRFALLTDDAGNPLEMADKGTTDVYLSVGDATNTVDGGVTSLGAVTTVKVSTLVDRVVRIHDFDERRVLLSRHPGEPVDAPATYIMIDTECTDTFGCVEVLVEQPGTAALLRSSSSEGPMVTELPAVGECSAEGLSRSFLTDDPGLADPVRTTRERMLRLAASCDIAALHRSAVEAEIDDSGTSILQFSHGYVDGIAGGEILGFRPLANLLEVFQLPSGQRDGVTVWPAIAAQQIDWENLTDAQIDTLVATYDRTILEDSRDMGWYTGMRIEIAADGSWAFFGRSLS